MSQTEAMPRPDNRIRLPGLGEFYADLLAVDAAINGRKAPDQAKSLLSSKLQEREPRIRERVGYLARKRGISDEEMWRQLASGEAEPLSPDEWEQSGD